MKPKRNKFFIFILFAFLVSTVHARPAQAQSSAAEHSGFFLFGAAGSALGLGALRMGIGQWEGGLLNQQVLGIDTLIFSAADVYATLGMGLSLAPRPGLAAFGGLGWEPLLFWKCHFRAEMNASAATTGQTIGQLLAGISLRF